MAESSVTGSTNEGNVVFCRNSGIGTEDDWDDSALIEAYDHAVGGIYKELDKRKGFKKTSGVTKWKIGSWCRAQFTDDGVWYEAKVVALDGDFCKVQYIGYLNEEEKLLSKLKPSHGNESRRSQIADAKLIDEYEKAITAEGAAYQSDCDSLKSVNRFDGTTRDAARPSTSGIKDRLTTMISNDNKEDQQSTYSARGRLSKDSNHERRKRGAFFQEGGTGIAFPPPPPPFPPGVDEICGSDEALAAMLMSWYISGYHTGYYQAMRQSRRS
ncbi:survival of motor neuron protein-like [Tropilaelaps mercedesae]|uniref:Survival of motor neuron protein-like n=1 Tax=Tropilaelaps mercedesae TaxID=418985 RepID=A0A1V9XLN2_9ACAR|nr:survival of motor neuron protein-like [Tropilaelaps mercedesae]